MIYMTGPAERLLFREGGFSWRQIQERENPVAGYSGIFLSEEQASILSGGQDIDKLLASITLGSFQKYYSSLF